MNFDIKFELKKIILASKHIKNTYSVKHTNSKYPLDLIIDELMYFFKSGVSWKLLRSTINYKTLFWHYRRFVENNVFVKLFNKIKYGYLKHYIQDQCSLLIDSTIIYNKYGINKIGRNKFYKNKNVTKISLMTDAHGFPLSVLFMKGNYHDNLMFNSHIRDAIVIMPTKKITIMADKAYSSNNNYSLLDKNNIKHIIPPRKNMHMAAFYKYDKKEYVKRIKIEHIFARLKTFKRLHHRYDKYLRNYSGFVYLAFAIIAKNIIDKRNN